MTEGRLGLRAVGGNLNEACSYLDRRRDEKDAQSEREKEEEEAKKQRRELGKTANGNWVNLGYLKTMADMGFDRWRSAHALKRTDNDIGQSIELLQTETDEWTLLADDSQETLARVCLHSYYIQCLLVNWQLSNLAGPAGILGL